MRMKAFSVKTQRIGFKATPDQAKAIEQRAQQCGVKVSAWMRHILLQAAKTASGPPGIVTVREPDGTTT